MLCNTDSTHTLTSFLFVHVSSYTGHHLCFGGFSLGFSHSIEESGRELLYWDGP